MREISKNKWKYSTIGLLAVLAVGFSFPQASAHITNGTQHMLQHIYNLLDTEVAEIKAKTDNLPSDPASDSSLFTQVIADSGHGMISCTSNDDFIVHIFSRTTPDGNFNLQILNSDGVNEGQVIFPNDGTEGIERSVTIGGGPDFTVRFGNSAGAPGNGFALFTLQTTEGAEASCVQEE